MGAEVLEFVAEAQEQLSSYVNILVVSSDPGLGLSTKFQLGNEGQEGIFMTFHFTTWGSHLWRRLNEGDITLVIGHVRELADCALFRPIKRGHPDLLMLAIGRTYIDNSLIRQSLESHDIPCLVGDPLECLHEVAVLIMEWVSINFALSDTPFPLKDGRVDTTQLRTLINFNLNETMFSSN